MGTFTISQSQSSANLFLIPSADGCNIDLTPVGEANNWECVDDAISSADDDTTYVESHSTNTKYDLYALPNHTTETGTINYVQLFGRAKSQGYAQHQDGIFKLIITDDACGNIYKSDDIDLTTSYANCSKVWILNPRTSIAFTWNDIDNIQAGLECDSPEVSGANEILTIRPNAAGDVTQLTPAGDTPNWKCVDDITKDDMSTVVKILYGESAEYDLYNLTNHTTESGPISKIVVFAWVYIYDAGLVDIKTVIKTGGSTFYDEQTPAADNTWILMSTEYAVNPDSAIAWTWGDIDALQAGIYLNPPTVNPDSFVACTQVYVAVHHTEDVSPEIRTTQVYAKVNYTPPATTCTLNKPEEISVDHSENVKMLNFWNGTREVYGLNRSNKSMVLNGSEYQTDSCNKACPCERITCVRNMGKDGSPITITGLRALFNNTYRIRSFGWRHISDKPEYYEWILELEYDD